MALQPKTVFVLGAGFTRAFLPKSPLLTDHYNVDALIEKFEHFPNAKRILSQEKQRKADGTIDIERLMTRLQGGMPYDYSHGAKDEFDLLLKEVKITFMRRLDEAKADEKNVQELKAFAKYCVSNGFTCITFNYDDILDQALWEDQNIHLPPPEGPLYWHPDGGYGFFCKPSQTCIREMPVYKDVCSMLLLKLHGSVNWQIRRGYQPPYTIDAIVHHQSWYPPAPAEYLPEELYIDYESIKNHLENEPFIVPPVLTKSDLVEQPILRLVWSLAYKELSEAEQVIFAGYSLPITDLASSFLFSEALGNLAHASIRIVNLAENEVKKQEIRECYKRIFSDIGNEQFDFRGVLEWSRKLTEANPNT